MLLGGRQGLAKLRRCELRNSSEVRSENTEARTRSTPASAIGRLKLTHLKREGPIAAARLPRVPRQKSFTCQTRFSWRSSFPSFRESIRTTHNTYVQHARTHEGRSTPLTHHNKQPRSSRSTPRRPYTKRRRLGQYTSVSSAAQRYRRGSVTDHGQRQRRAVHRRPVQLVHRRRLEVAVRERKVKLLSERRKDRRAFEQGQVHAETEAAAAVEDVVPPDVVLRAEEVARVLVQEPAGLEVGGVRSPQVGIARAAPVVPADTEAACPLSTDLPCGGSGTQTYKSPFSTRGPPLGMTSSLTACQAFLGTLCIRGIVSHKTG